MTEAYPFVSNFTSQYQLLLPQFNLESFDSQKPLKIHIFWG